MLKLLAELNKLGNVDIGFFIACVAIVVLIVVIYFLIPVFNKKQYQEQRENLKKREAAFHANKKVDKEEPLAFADVENNKENTETPE